MNYLQVSFAVTVLVLVFGAQTGQALKCHICNSGENYEGEECDDPLETDKFLTDCNEYAEENNFPEAFNASYCRKLIQTVQGEYRIVRSCAQDYGNIHRCIERTGTKAVKVSYCECDGGDGCNTATAVTTPLLTLFLTACLALFIRS